MEYKRRNIRRECSKRLQIAGFKRVAYNHIATDQEGKRIIIPLALLDDDNRPSIAIRIRKPRKREITPEKAISKRSETITKITGCQVITVHSMSEAIQLPYVIKSLFKIV